MKTIIDILEHERFMDEAFEEAKKSRCFKQQAGVVIVKEGKILTRGNNHPVESYCEKCVREELGLHGGSNVEICYSVHAE